MGIYGDTTKILHSLLDLGEAAHLTPLPFAFLFFFCLGNKSQSSSV